MNCEWEGNLLAMVLASNSEVKSRHGKYQGPVFGEVFEDYMLQVLRMTGFDHSEGAGQVSTTTIKCEYPIASINSSAFLTPLLHISAQLLF